MGVWARPKANSSRPPFPTIFLSIARWICSNMDEMHLRLVTQWTIYNCCSMIFTETWSDSTTPDEAIELEGCTAYRTTNSCKKTGGGLCIYINNSWCTNTTV